MEQQEASIMEEEDRHKHTASPLGKGHVSSGSSFCRRVFAGSKVPIVANGGHQTRRGDTITIYHTTAQSANFIYRLPITPSFLLAFQLLADFALHLHLLRLGMAASLASAGLLGLRLRGLPSGASRSPPLAPRSLSRPAPSVKPKPNVVVGLRAGILPLRYASPCNGSNLQGGGGGGGGGSGGGGGGDEGSNAGGWGGDDDASSKMLVALFLLKRTMSIDPAPTLAKDHVLWCLMKLVSSLLLQCGPANANDRCFGETSSATSMRASATRANCAIGGSKCAKGIGDGCAHRELMHSALAAHVHEFPQHIAIPVGSKAKHSISNNNDLDDESRSVQNNNLSNRDTETASVIRGSKDGNGSNENEKEAILGELAFVHGIAEKLIPVFLVLVGFLLQATVSSPWINVLVGAVAIAIPSSFLVLGSIAYYETDPSVHPGFEWAITYVLLELMFLYAALVITAFAWEAFPSWFAWVIGLIGECSIALYWVAFLQRPKIVFKWMKAICEKMPWVQGFLRDSNPQDE